MSSAINLKELAAPFAAEDIEWRAQRADMSQRGPYAMVLAYVTNRAIQQRLDDVCSPENWCNEYKQGPQGGVLCGLSIQINNQWVTKWDGADNTDIEKIKGGLSDSMKRAAVQWGIGRYLYKLEATFARCVTEKPKAMAGWTMAKSKDKKTTFWWSRPPLPDWALPPHPMQAEIDAMVVAVDSANATDELRQLWAEAKDGGYLSAVAAHIKSKQSSLKEAA